MLKKISSKVISHIFSRYINELDPSQLEFEIWNGKAHLEDVSVCPEAFSAHDLPIVVKKGTIGSIDLVFPWSRLGTEPCIVTVKNVFIVADVSAQVLINRDLKPEVSVPQEKSRVSEGGILNGILVKVIDNIRFEIENVHVRVELQHGDTSLAFGLLIPNISVNSIDENGETCFIPVNSPVFRKNMQVHELGMYLDWGTGFINTENFEEEMATKRNHSYILKPFSFDATLIHNRVPDAEFQDRVVINTERLELLLEASQCRGLMALHRRYLMFNKMRMFSHCGRPDRYPRSDRSSGLWWRYAHLCAEQQTQKTGSFDVESALDVLMNRGRYFELLKQKRDKDIEEMEDHFDGKTVTFLRANAETMLEAEDSRADLSLEECQGLETDSKIGPFSAELHIGELSLHLLAKPDTPITRLIGRNMDLTYRRNDSLSSSVLFTLCSFQLLNDMNPLFQQVLASVSAEKVLTCSCEVMATAPYELNMSLPPVVFVLDFSWIRHMVNFFKPEKPKLKDEQGLVPATRSEIQKAIENQMRMNVHITLESLKLRLVYAEIEDQPSLDLILQTVTVTSRAPGPMSLTDFSSCFTLYLVTAEEGYFALDNRIVSEKFSGQINFQKAIAITDLFPSTKVEIELSRGILNAEASEVYLLREGILYFVDNYTEMFSTPGWTDLIMFKLSIPHILLNVHYERRQLLQFTADKFQVVAAVDMNIDVRISGNSLKAVEFFGQFPSLLAECKDEITMRVNFSETKRDIEVNPGRFVLYGQEAPINFVVNFFRFMDDFEVRLGWKESPPTRIVAHQGTPSKLDINIVVMSNDFTMNLGEMAIMKAAKAQITFVYKSFGYDLLMKMGRVSIITDQLGKWDSMLELDEANVDFHTFSIFSRLVNGRIVVYYSWFMDLARYFLRLIHYGKDEVEAPNQMIYSDVDLETENVDVIVLPSITSSAFTIKSPKIQYTMSKVPQDSCVLFENPSVLCDGCKWLDSKQITVSLGMDLMMHADGAMFTSYIQQNPDIQDCVAKTSQYLDEDHPDVERINVFLWIIGVKMHINIDGMVLLYDHRSCSLFRKWVYSLFEEVKPAEAYNMNFDFRVQFEDSDITLLDSSASQLASLRLGGFSYSVTEDGQELTFGSVSLSSVRPCDEYNESITSNTSPDRPFAICRFVGREFTVTFANVSFYVHQKFALVILKFLFECPFLGEADDLLPDDYVPVTINVNADLILLTIPTKQGLPDLVLTTAISMSWGSSNFWVHVSDMGLAYEGKSNYIIMPVSCEIKKQVVDGVIHENVSVTDMFVHLSTNDILLLLKTFQDFMKENEGVISMNQDSMSTETSPLVMRVFLMPIEVTLYRPQTDHLQFPFLKWNLSSFEFNLTRQKGSITSSCELYQCVLNQNYATGDWDPLVEDFEIAATCSTVNDVLVADVNVTNEIIMNFTSEFLKELLAFEYQMRSLPNDEVACDITSVIIRNCMGTNIRIHFTDNEIDLDSDSEISLECLTDSRIGISYTQDLSTPEVFFSPNDIACPLYISSCCVVFSEARHGGRLITISSPFLIENKTSENIEVFIQKSDGILKSGTPKSIGVARGHEAFHIPPGITLKDYTFLFRGENAPESESQKRFTHRKFDLPARSYTVPTVHGNFCCTIRETIDKRRMIGKIVIIPSLTIFNECPLELDVNFVESRLSVQILSGESMDIPSISTHNLLLSCAIKLPGYEYSAPRFIGLHGNSSKPIRFVMTSSDGKRVVELAAVTDHVLDPAQASVYFYSPVTIFTRLPVPVIVKAPGEDSSALEFDGHMMMYSSNKYFKSEEIQAQLACPGISKWSEESIDCVLSDISGVLFVPHIEYKSIYIPIRHVTRDPGSPYLHAHVLTLVPALSVVNELDREFCLMPQDTEVDYPDVMKPGAKTHVLLSNKEFSYRLCIDGFEPCDDLIMAQPVKTVFRVFGDNESVVIEMEVVEDGYGLCAHFRYQTFPTPIVVCNLLETVEFNVYHLYETDKILCKPQTTSSFAFDEPFGEQFLVIEIENTHVNVSVEDDSDAERLGGTRFFFETRTVRDGVRMVIVSEEPCLAKTRRRSVTVSMEGVYVSFVDEKWREVLAMAFDKLILKLDTNDKYHMIEFSIDSFQVDDQCLIPAFPVSIIGSSTQAHKFLRVSAVANRNTRFLTSFKYFSILVQKIQVFADLAFISDVFSYFDSLFKRRPSSKAVLDPSVTSDPDKVYSFKQLEVHPILILFSMRTVTGRPYIQPIPPELPITKIRIFGNMTETSLMLNCVVAKNLRASLGYLKHMFIDQYQNSLMNQLLASAGHPGVLLNGLARGVSSELDSVYYNPEEGILQDPHSAAGEEASPGDDFIRSIASVTDVRPMTPRKENIFPSLAKKPIGTSKDVTTIAGGIYKISIQNAGTYNRHRQPYIYVMARVDHAASEIQASKIFSNIGDDTLLACVDETENPTIFVLFQNRFVILKRKSLRTESSHPLLQLVDPRVAGNRFIFSVQTPVARTKQSHTYVCASEEAAQQLLAVIASQTHTYHVLL